MWYNMEGLSTVGNGGSTVPASTTPSPPQSSVLEGDQRETCMSAPCGPPLRYRRGPINVPEARKEDSTCADLRDEAYALPCARVTPRRPHAEHHEPSRTPVAARGRAWLSVGLLSRISEHGLLRRRSGRPRMPGPWNPPARRFPLGCCISITCVGFRGEARGLASNKGGANGGFFGKTLGWGETALR